MMGVYLHYFIPSIFLSLPPIYKDKRMKSKEMESSCVTSSLLFSLLLPLIFLSLPPSYAKDTVQSGDSVADGETLVSPGAIFELGFFSPGSSKNRYVGIWYYNFSTNTVLWVANRENPVTGTSGVLAVGADGSLVIRDGAAGPIVWSANVSTTSNSSTLQLNDTGNFALYHSDEVVWQSFDNPTDTYIPGMKVGLNLKTNVNRLLTSWRSDDDPGVGSYSLGMDPKRSQQIVLWEGSKPRWRSGRWDGQVFIGIQDMVPQYIYGFKLSNFEQEQIMYFYYSAALNTSHRYVLASDGIVKHTIWKEDAKFWSLFWAQPVTECELYNKCGDFASCADERTPICRCLEGFDPRSNDEWSRGNWSGGCVRRTRLQCEGNVVGGKSDGFLKMERVKLPDLSDWDSDVLNESDCRERCLGNCSCTAYSYVTGIRCLLWGVNLVDIHVFNSSSGKEMYLKLAGSELENKKNIPTAVIVTIVLVAVLLLGCIYLSWNRRKRINEFLRLRNGREVESTDTSRGGEGRTRLSRRIEIRCEANDDGNNCELPILSLESVVEATNNFSEINLLGEGGFGPVYKGVLPGGQEIAVKRLSRSSGQGLEEFKAEVILIAKLQHRNLVRILSFCIHGEEMILIYEYMANGSLDAFLFDSRKSGMLNWSTRHKIIEGVARGLLYLHRDSRLRVIHRDLKASNILLDEEMNPKISDFGMARIFGKDDNETNTKRVVGTYGYMSPEYAMQGLFSVKSDVYSFGVLLLEIVSGKKNSTYYNSEHSLSLLSYAWKLWNEDDTIELVDPTVRGSCSQSEALRCVNVGLLCVQDRAIDRPTMSSVVIMLESGTTGQPQPRQPLFAGDRSLSETDSSTSDRKVTSANVSITALTAR